MEIKTDSMQRATEESIKSASKQIFCPFQSNSKRLLLTILLAQIFLISIIPPTLSQSNEASSSSTIAPPATLKPSKPTNRRLRKTRTPTVIGLILPPDSKFLQNLDQEQGRNTELELAALKSPPPPPPPPQPLCTLGNDTYHVGQKWNPNLPPNGVQACVLCECHTRLTANGTEAYVGCTKLAKDCPKIDLCPSGEKPVAFPDQCCKMCSAPITSNEVSNRPTPSITLSPSSTPIGMSTGATRKAEQNIKPHHSTMSPGSRYRLKANMTKLSPGFSLGSLGKVIGVIGTLVVVELDDTGLDV